MRFATHFGLQQYLELWTPECSKKDSSLEDLPSFNCYDTPLKPNAEDAFELVASQAPDVPVFLLRYKESSNFLHSLMMISGLIGSYRQQSGFVAISQERFSML